VRFLIDECLHTSLVRVAEARGHEARHVNWIGLSGETDWNLMLRIAAEDFTFVTSNARDFRKLYGRQKLHAGLIVIVPQVVPDRQRALFDAVLDQIGLEEPVNEVIEVELDEGAAVITRYELPGAGA
jgi:predicted nuclease of predicted toxin-antitoxin system